MRSSFLALVAASVVGVVPVSGPGAAAVPPSAIPAEPLQPGDRVVAGPVAAIVPQPGRGVWTEAILPDGSTAELMVETQGDGTVVVRSGTSDGIGVIGLPTSPADCSDQASSLLPFRWADAVLWFFNARSTPAGVRKFNAEGAMRAGMANITTADNDCGIPDRVQAVATYGGRRPEGGQIRADGTCRAGRDGLSVVGFGDLQPGQLGVACTWYAGENALETDVRLNKTDHRWVVHVGPNCRDKWSVQGIVTHEWGHSFGLAHVSELEHGFLTMSESVNGPCQSSEASLGQGDLVGLEAKYR